MAAAEPAGSVQAVRRTLAKGCGVMFVAQAAIGALCVFAANDLDPDSDVEAFTLFAGFALIAAGATLVLAAANLVRPAAAAARPLAAAGGVLLGAALVYWVAGYLANDIGGTWVWLGLPLWLINGWLAIGTWRTPS